MASIEVIIRDGQGNLINQGKSEEIDLTHAHLDTIETAVEDWRKQALPEIEAQLLGQSQSKFTVREKTS